MNLGGSGSKFRSQDLRTYRPEILNMAMAQVWIFWAGFWYHSLSPHVPMKQTFKKKKLFVWGMLFSDYNEP